jgi:hypothetical protein
MYADDQVLVLHSQTDTSCRLINYRVYRRMPLIETICSLQRRTECHTATHRIFRRCWRASNVLLLLLLLQNVLRSVHRYSTFQCLYVSWNAKINRCQNRYTAWELQFFASSAHLHIPTFSLRMFLYFSVFVRVSKLVFSHEFAIQKLQLCL